MSKNSVAKGKKHANGHIRVIRGLISEFFLGDIVFTLLPIGITALLKYIFGTLDRNFFLVSDWAFASIIISSLALTRSLELKIIYQKDTSLAGIALSRICILLIIFSTISLSLHILKEQGIKIEDDFIAAFHLYALAAGVCFLFMAHYSKEKLFFDRERFSEKISARDFHFYSLENLIDARNNIRATRIAFNKKYEFFSKNNDAEDIKEYGKVEINRIIEDMQNDLNVLKERMEAWKNPPYDKAATPEAPDDSGQ